MKIGKWDIENNSWRGLRHIEFSVYKDGKNIQNIGWNWRGHVSRMDITAKHFGWFWRSYR